MTARAKTSTPKKAGTRKKRAPRRKKRTAATRDPATHGDAPDEVAQAVAARDEMGPLMAYRMRMRLVGDLLNASVGELADCGAGSDRVGRGAYLHIMGQVFEALDGLTQAVPLDDLVRLSRVVAEQRRAELNTRKVEAIVSQARAARGSSNNGDTDHADTGGNYRLPAHFNEMVRQLYGVTLADDANTESANESEPRP